MPYNPDDWCDDNEDSFEETNDTDFDDSVPDCDRFSDYDDDLIDGVGFADPGGNSALRAETPDNPRNLPCPTCGRENMLTPIDVAHHYQCDYCADQAERGGY